jgi:hypothetical protein
MNYQPTTEPVQCQTGDTFAMHEGKPTLMRNGEVVAVAWANSREEFEIRVPEPEPEQMAFFECDYSWNSIGWQKLRCGPMTMAEAKALSKQIEIAKAFYRNSRIVPVAPPQELWGAHRYSGPGPVFVCDSRELAEKMAEFLDDPADVRVWDGKVQPRCGYVYATRQGTP